MTALGPGFSAAFRVSTGHDAPIYPILGAVALQRLPRSSMPSATRAP